MDSQTRQALLAYYLSLILKHIGGADLTDCNTVIANFSAYADYDEAKLEVLELQMTQALMTLTGTTIPTLAAAREASACLRNSLPPYALRAFQFILWDEIVNVYNP